MNDWKEFFLSVKDVQWIDFKKLVNWSYLSDTALPLTSPLVALLGYVFLAIIIIGIIFSAVLGKKNKKLPIYSKLIGHITNMSLWLGIIGLILVLGRFQGIYMLSSRLLLLANLLAITIWSAWILYYSLVILPNLSRDHKKRQAIEKYLPKKKKIRL
ncbi:MAG: hypothetical protein Q7S37_00115 [bacterium]|nr:hypothetical protein [bacterium]